MASLYNHKEIGPLPPIPNKEFKQLCDRVADGMPIEQIRQVAEVYSLEEHQKHLINSLYRLKRTFKRIK